MKPLVDAVRPTLGPRPRLVAIDNVDYHDKTAQAVRRWRDHRPSHHPVAGPGRRHGRHVGPRPVVAPATAGRRWDCHCGRDPAKAVTTRACATSPRVATRCGSSLLGTGHASSSSSELTAMSVTARGQGKAGPDGRVPLLRPALGQVHGRRSLTSLANGAGWRSARVAAGRCEREYVEGMYWDHGLLSREMYTDHQLSPGSSMRMPRS